jgi:hypothetical protein
VYFAGRPFSSKVWSPVMAALKFAKDSVDAAAGLSATGFS